MDEYSQEFFAPRERPRLGLNRMRAAAPPVLLMLAFTLTGCASSSNEPIPVYTSTRPSMAATPTTPVNPSPPFDDETVEPVPEATENSQSAAIVAAERAVTAFARPDLRYDAWIAGLYPQLTQAGATAYEDTDPANVPVRQVTGPGTILPASTEVALIVQVPTDAGPYNISMSRPGPDAPWLADRIRPADG
ncbi:hypothetical protein DEA06_14750 [Microbacterium sp. Gd 4-13]|uniref:hypothetical protein n=1 Tax=Microbacterium sp. Gd 4-13 TaxID=2173179 RepID=UPI000D58616C|nr:hypothetical protein [Microbacterium sp. Gd 4-13]PVW03017.1 hypothetical protein DEA06_14750 [Microbacterium sp. Gd 4-13]